MAEPPKSQRKSLWSLGQDYSNYYKDFQEIVDKKEPASPPKILDSPKFPDTPPVKEDAAGKPIIASGGTSPRPQDADEKKFLKLPSANTMSFAQTLKTPNAYPQMEGPFEVVQATPEELATVNTFLQTFEFWVILAKLFFGTKFYKEQWEAKNKYDLVFMRLDPILISSTPQPLYVHLTEIGIPSISGCNLDKFKVDVRGEKSKNPHAKIFNKYRRDREYTITADISCPSIEGKAFYVLTNNNNQPDPNAEKGSLKFVLQELKINLGLILTKIDDNFETVEIRYRPPKVSLKYDMKNAEVTIEKFPQSSPIPQKECERLFKEYKDKEIIAKKDQIAQRLIDIYEMRLTPLIVQLRWIHQLHDVMYFTMVNEDKVIPEFSKIQTKLVEVVFFTLAHTKIRQLIFDALEQESYKPFKKLVYFRESPELRTAKKVNTLISNASKMGKEDIYDEISDVVEYEMTTTEKKFKRIVDMQFYIMRFFTESILI